MSSEASIIRRHFSRLGDASSLTNMVHRLYDDRVSQAHTSVTIPPLIHLSGPEELNILVDILYVVDLRPLQWHRWSPSSVLPLTYTQEPQTRTCVCCLWRIQSFSILDSHPQAIIGLDIVWLCVFWHPAILFISGSGQQPNDRKLWDRSYGFDFPSAKVGRMYRGTPFGELDKLAAKL